MQIDWWTLGLQTVNFLIVVWLLSRFLYRPIRRIIDEREATDRKAGEDAKSKAEAAEAARQDYERKLADLAEAQRKREAEFHADLEKERDGILNAAREKAADLLADAKDQTSRQEAQALENLKHSVLDLAKDLARTALADGDVAGMVQVTRHLDGLAKPDLDDLRQDLTRDGALLEIVTPAALPEDQRDAWSKALSDRFGGEPRLVFREDPGILRGVELHFPHAVLKFSAADRLARAAAALQD